MVRKLAWDVQGPGSILSTGKNKNVNQTELGGMRLYTLSTWEDEAESSRVAGLLGLVCFPVCWTFWLFASTQL